MAVSIPRRGSTRDHTPGCTCYAKYGAPCSKRGTRRSATLPRVRPSPPSRHPDATMHNAPCNHGRREMTGTDTTVQFADKDFARSATSPSLLPQGGQHVLRPKSADESVHRTTNAPAVPSSQCLRPKRPPSDLFLAPPWPTSDAQLQHSDAFVCGNDRVPSPLGCAARAVVVPSFSGTAVSVVKFDRRAVSTYAQASVLSRSALDLRPERLAQGTRQRRRRPPSPLIRWRASRLLPGRRQRQARAARDGTHLGFHHPPCTYLRQPPCL